MRQIKGIILTIILSFFGITSMMATHDGDVLKITMKNGDIYGYLLQDRPVITFNTDSLYLTTDNFTMALPFSYNEIDKIEFEDNAITGVDQPTVNHHELKITYLDGEHVIINGVDEKSQWRVFGIDGKQVQVPADRAGQVLTFSLTPLISGVYIIRVDNYSFKIRKK
ncbi:MAG: hypothetical protein J5957_04130 [Prevotella sp.]|nr:hypothetical protein [Prevotella sp.]